MALEPFPLPIDPRDISPEHVVGEHRVGLGLLTKLDGAGTEHGIVLGLFDGPQHDAHLVCVRLLTVEQASQLGAFLLETAARARACNTRAAKGKEGC